MPYAIAAGIVLILAVAFVAFKRRAYIVTYAAGVPDDPLRCPLRLRALFSAPVTLEPARLAETYESLWEEPLTCEMHAPSSDVLREYTLSSGARRVWLTIENTPIRRGDIVMLEDTSPRLDEDDRAALRVHVAAACIHYRWDGEDNREMGRFMVKVLMALMQEPAAIGYLSLSAVRYVPRAELDRVGAEHDPLAPAALFLLFTNVMREMVEDGRCWLHTHGLEQFGLPELHILAGENIADDEDLLVNTVLYCLTNGPVLQAGQLAGLADGATFRIEHLPNGTRGHDGLYGMLELVKQEGEGCPSNSAGL